jgi:hypothetical protein
MKTNNKSLYTIAVFTVSKQFKSKAKAKDIIASIQYRYDIFDNIDFKKLIKYNMLFRFSRELVIYHILNKLPKITMDQAGGEEYRPRLRRENNILNLIT